MIGGAVVEGVSWQWVFWLNVPIGLAAIPLVLRRIDESFGAEEDLDVRGVALVTAGALGLVWGLERGNAAGWFGAEVLASLGGGAALTAAFVAWELRASSPMLPMRFFRSRAFSAGNAATFFMFASLFGAVFFVAQFLQTALGYGALATGLRVLPWTAPLMVVPPIAGALADRVGARPLVVGGLTLQAVAMGWIALVAEPDLAYAGLVPPLFLAGCGIATAIPAAQNCVVGAVPVGALGKAAATTSTMRQLGSAFGIATQAAVFAASGGFASAAAFTDGFAPAVAVAGGLSLAGAVAGLASPGRRKAAGTAPTHPVPAPETEGGR